MSHSQKQLIHQELKFIEKMEKTSSSSALLDSNRARVLQALKSKGIQTDGSFLNKKVSSSVQSTQPAASIGNSMENRVQKNMRDVSNAQTKQPLKPMIRKYDYIDYDLSQMRDSNGGFIDSSMYPSNFENSKTGSSASSSGMPQAGMTFSEWKIAKANQMDRVGMGDLYPLKDEDKVNLDLAVRKEYVMIDGVNVLAPSSDLPTCESCHKSIEFDSQLLAHFERKVCRKCVSLKPEKYSLLTKTECKNDYLLTDPELEDRSLFHRMEKQNPHSGTYSRMILFLREEVEQYAFKKWGGHDKLDAEWVRREERKITIKEKKYQKQLKEMRKKTRAQEFTKKLQLKKFGKSHVHEWVVVNIDETTSCITKECKDCKQRIEEIEF